MTTSVSESYFWTQVKAGVATPDHDGEVPHLSRIENTAGTGISDVSACSRGVEVWLELKVFHGNDLHFRTSQRIWINARLKAGGRVLVVARSGDCFLIYKASAILAAKYTLHKDGKSFHVKGADLPAPESRGIKPFRWAEIRERLFDTY